jgi:hypothetical protein
MYLLPQEHQEGVKRAVKVVPCERKGGRGIEVTCNEPRLGWNSLRRWQEKYTSMSGTIFTRLLYILLLHDPLYI